MPDSERTARGYDILRSLGRWIRFPRGRRPRVAAEDAGVAVLPAPRQEERSGTPLLWCHADSAGELAALAGLLRALREEADAPELLLTAHGPLPETPAADGLPEGVTLCDCPPEDPAAIRAFLYRRRPDICLWAGSSYPPQLIAATVDSGIPVINVNATFPNNIWRRARGVRRSLRQLMEKFQAVYPVDAPSRDGLLKFGLPDGLVRDAGALATLPEVLPYDETLRTQLGRAIGNRPVWLAFGVRPDELPTVLEAYRDAARLTHRLLLVLAPANPRDVSRFTAQLAKDDWSIAIRSEGQEPVYDTRIVLEDTGEELGMWLRIAPVAFLGNSLTRGGGTDPMVAAALGSAILHGPFVSVYQAAYDKLTAAGGAVQVTSAKSLAEAVCEVSIPDRAAAMAHAAWQIESDGAEVIRQVEQEILGCLQPKGKTP